MTKCLLNGGVVPAGSSAVDLVDGEVRELIRRRGLDPFSDPAPVRMLVRDVVADYSERSLSSALPPIGDPEGLVRDVLDRVAGYGPLQRWLDDPEVEEIWVNEPGRVFIARRGRSELTTTILGAGQLADLVERMLRSSGRRIDMSTPFVDANIR
jgi:pilus assembly protein CpaF